MFRDESFLQMINVVARENDLKPLTIPHLKMCLNGEHNSFKKSSHQAVINYHEKAN